MTFSRICDSEQTPCCDVMDGDLNTAKLIVNEEKLQACLTRLLESFWSFSFPLPLKNTFSCLLIFF